MAGHCGSGAFRDLLEFHGLSWFDEPMSEAMAFGLGGGLGCFFYELPEMDPPLYLVGRGGGLERGVCEHLEIDLDLRRTDDPDEAWQWLSDELDAGRPTMVNADIKELDYLRVKLSNTMHDIVVTGYSDGVALIADNDREEIQRCSIESLQRARGSQGFPGPSHHATWVMRFPERLPDPRVAVDRAVGQSVANMTAGAEGLAGLEPGCGLDHVASFAASYPDWPERYGESGRLGAALGGLWVFIVKAGTGGAMFRSLQAGFLRESAELLDDSRLAEAADVYSSLAGEWVALADAAAGARSGDPVAAHTAGLPHVEAIARLEREGAEAMARAVSAAAA
jgi:hypothetical protein